MPQITLQPDGTAGLDAQLNDALPDTNYETSTTSFVGISGGGTLYRFICEFDLSSIPSGSTINSATLTLVCDFVDEVGDARDVGIYRVTQDWLESEVTWNSYSTGNSWSTAGGDFDATAEDTTSVTGTGSYTWDLQALVQEWVDGTANEGFIAKFPTESGAERKRFETSDSATSGNRPKLVIDYTPVGGFFYMSQ